MSLRGATLAFCLMNLFFCPREAGATRLLDDRRVKRTSRGTIRFADESAKKQANLRRLHRPL